MRGKHRTNGPVCHESLPYPLPRQDPLRLSELQSRCEERLQQQGGGAPAHGSRLRRGEGRVGHLGGGVHLKSGKLLPNDWWAVGVAVAFWGGVGEISRSIRSRRMRHRPTPGPLRRLWRAPSPRNSSSRPTPASLWAILGPFLGTLADGPRPPARFQNASMHAERPGTVPRPERPIMVPGRQQRRPGYRPLGPPSGRSQGTAHDRCEARR
jgi:hypothetical protein